MKERKQTIVQWSVVYNFSLVIINLHPQARLFSVFRSNGGKREATMKCESRSRRSEKKYTRKNTCNPQNRRNVLRFFDKQRQEWSEHEEWVTHGRRSTKKKEGETSCTLYLHQLFKLFFPQTPAETTTNMVLCRGNIFSKEMTVTSKHMFLCERNL